MPLKIIPLQAKRYMLDVRHQWRVSRVRPSIKKALDPATNLLVFANSRGGSTWLTDLLIDKDTTVVWEPTERRTMEGYKPGLYDEIGNTLYIPEHGDFPEAKKFFQDLFTGKFIHPDMVNFNEPANYTNPTRAIIKFCKGTALLPWLCANFDIRPIHFVRHPLAVVSSQLRHSSFNYNDFQPDVTSYQRGRYRDLFNKYKDRISHLKSVEQMFAAWWCLSNVEAITAPDPKWLTVTYEGLVLDPMRELARIERFVGVTIGDHIRASINKPSATTQTGSNILGKGNQLETWQKHLTSTQVQDIMQVVEGFGLSMYSTASVPDIDAIEREPLYSRVGKS